MSILDKQSSVDLLSKQIVNKTQQTFNTIVRAFNDGTILFWNNPKYSPSEIAESLGSNAVEIFKLHYMLGQLISQIKPDSISNSVQLIGKFTMNSDGTVTIIEDEPKDTTPPSIPEDLNATLINEI